MHEEPTTVILQRYLDVLPEGTAAEPIIRELLERAVGRLCILCATLLYKSYARLTRPPVNLETDELLGGVVARLLTALRATRPPTGRQFFATARCSGDAWDNRTVIAVVASFPGRVEFLPPRQSGRETWRGGPE
jgi:hypothetical protein